MWTYASAVVGRTLNWDGQVFVEFFKGWMNNPNTWEIKAPPLLLMRGTWIVHNKKIVQGIDIPP